MDIERKEDLELDGVTSYHVMLEQLASPTDEQQKKYKREAEIDSLEISNDYGRQQDASDTKTKRNSRTLTRERYGP
uniref:Uncharacterized protein n=1 Tax=Megaselia scalaris TaxID=36166 RepID=T1GSX8_MEGSC